MAKVKTVGLCPRCQGELPEGEKTKCLHCGFQFPYQTEVFGTPDYVAGQYDVILEDINQDKKEKDRDLKLWSLKRAFGKYFINMSDSDRILLMRDAEAVMRFLLTSNSSGESMKKVVEIGKRIGELTKHTDELIKLGGVANGFFDTAKPGAGNQDQNELGGEGDTPS